MPIVQLIPFSLFFLLFAVKNVNNAYFKEHFGCAAPKRCTKYTSPPSK